MRQSLAYAISLAVASLAATASAQFTARSTINVTGIGNVATEPTYVAGVCNCENGAASFEALKAQAVAARTFAYYKMNTSGSIANGTSDQVYTCSSGPQAIHLAAAQATEGEILYIRDNLPPTVQDVLIASFYVAGAIPTGPFNPNAPSAIPNPTDSDPTNTNKWVTYTYEQGLIGGNNTGTPLGFRGTPTNPNWPNRGAMSQNGADFLSDNSISYVDILKYYYGADIQLRTATTVGTSIQYGQKILSNFDNYGQRNGTTYQGHEGYFQYSPTASPTTTANVAGSTAVRSRGAFLSGGYSQSINITYDETSTAPFLLRHLSGARFNEFSGSNHAAEPVANLQFESIGSVGFWLRTTSPGIEVAIAIDEPTTSEIGSYKSVIADGQWHKYQWHLDRALDWNPFEGGDGALTSAMVSLDSILFRGASDALIYMDDVFWNPQAAITNPAALGDFNNNGVVDAADYTVWQDTLGSTTNLAADGDNSGTVDAADLPFWQNNFGQVLSASASSTSLVPEPSSVIPALTAIIGLLVSRPSSSPRLRRGVNGFERRTR